MRLTICLARWTEWRRLAERRFLTFSLRRTSAFMTLIRFDPVRTCSPALFAVAIP
jgi:hypothetical protein